jgi:hypothetical protein
MMPPEDELCILLARGQLPPEAERRARALLGGELAWNQILKNIRAHQILPLVCSNLQRLGFPGVPQPVGADLTALYRDNAVRNALFSQELARLLALMAEAQVPAMPIKGIPLAECLYGDPALRVCADIDIYVPSARFPEAFNILLSAGYQAGVATPQLVRLLARYGKDYLLMRRDSLCWYPLQLHGGLIWGGPAERRLAEQIWSAAPRSAFHGVPAFALSPAWEFLYLAVHAARHGSRPLKWLVDLDLICGRGNLDWGDVANKTRRWRWGPAVRSAMAACAAVFDTPLPPFLRDTRTAGHKLPAYRLADSEPSALQILKENLLGVRLLASWREKLQFIAARLLAPNAADCQWLRLPPRLFFLYYVLRPVRVMCLVARWLAAAGGRKVRPAR